MKTRLVISALAIIALAAFNSPLFAQCDGSGAGGGVGGGFGNGVGGYVDDNGDGYNDLAPDADGDGIPNGLDPDYTGPLDGSGRQVRNGAAVAGEDGFINREAYQIKGAGVEILGNGPGDCTGSGEGSHLGNGNSFARSFGDGTCIPALDGSGFGGSDMSNKD